MTGNNVTAFADEYARFTNELEGVPGSIEYLSQRGLVNALLAVFRELQHDRDPVSVITEGICVYREWERRDDEENRAHQAAEERQYTEWAAAETRTRRVACPSCGAKPGDMCHRPNGMPAAESHRYRARAARQLGDGEPLGQALTGAGLTDTPPDGEPVRGQ